MLGNTLTRVQDLELAYRAHGVGATLILLHAFPLNQRMWDGQVAALADICHVVTLDLPGFGASQATDGDATIDELADLIVAFAHRLGHERFVLGGLSMGGYIALAVARRHPEVLQGLILADTRAAADTDAARAKRFSQIAEIEARGLGALAASFPHAVTAAATALDRPEVLAQVERWIREARPEAVAGALRMMAARPDATPVLASLQVPTLVIVGEADDTTPPAEADAMAAAVAGARLVRLANAGHLANLEAPEAFNAAVAGFMLALR